MNVVINIQFVMVHVLAIKGFVMTILNIVYIEYAIMGTN